MWQVYQNLDEKIDLFWKLEPIRELPPYRFEGKLQKRLSWLDYPRDKFGYPIVSRKMVNFLLLVGEFQHQVIPLKIHDYQSEKITDDFVFLHLLESIKTNQH